MYRTSLESWRPQDSKDVWYEQCRRKFFSKRFAHPKYTVEGPRFQPVRVGDGVTLTGDRHGRCGRSGWGTISSTGRPCSRRRAAGAGGALALGARALADGRQRGCGIELGVSAPTGGGAAVRTRRLLTGPLSPPVLCWVEWVVCRVSAVGRAAHARRARGHSGLGVHEGTVGWGIEVVTCGAGRARARAGTWTQDPSPSRLGDRGDVQPAGAALLTSWCRTAGVLPTVRRVPGGAGRLGADRCQRDDRMLGFWAALRWASARD